MTARGAITYKVKKYVMIDGLSYNLSRNRQKLLRCPHLDVREGEVLLVAGKDAVRACLTGGEILKGILEVFGLQPQSCINACLAHCHDLHCGAQFTKQTIPFKERQPFPCQIGYIRKSQIGNEQLVDSALSHLEDRKNGTHKGFAELYCVHHYVGV